MGAVSCKKPISDRPLEDHVVSGFFWFRTAGEMLGHRRPRRLGRTHQQRVLHDGVPTSSSPAASMSECSRPTSASAGAPPQTSGTSRTGSGTCRARGRARTSTGPIMQAEAAADGVPPPAGTARRRHRRPHGPNGARPSRSSSGFLVIGLSSVAVNLATYAAMVRWGGVQTDVAKGISYILGMIVGFIGNKLWTFRSTARARPSPSRT